MQLIIIDCSIRIWKEIKGMNRVIGRKEKGVIKEHMSRDRRLYFLNREGLIIFS